MEEQQENKSFKAPPEDPVAVAKHWRAPEPAEIAAAEKFANQVRRMHQYGARMTNEEKEFFVALQHEEMFRTQVAAGYLEAASDLAHALISQGRYEEAMVADPARREECWRLIEARDREDNERCDCPSQKIENVNVPSEIVVRRQWMPQRKQFGYLIRCSQCGQLNLVSDLHPEIAEFHHYRLEKMSKKK
jgi:hypothetical protein